MILAKNHRIIGCVFLAKKKLTAYLTFVVFFER